MTAAARAELGDELPLNRSHAPAKPRLDSIDLVRGAAMVLMVLDHTRELFCRDPSHPTNLRTVRAAAWARSGSCCTSLGWPEPSRAGRSSCSTSSFHGLA